MSGRRILGLVLTLVGLVTGVVGVVGLVAGDGDGERAAPSPTPVASPTPRSTTPASPTGESPTPSPTPSPTVSPTEAPAEETPEEFFALLSEALANGDQAFLVSRLHPFVADRYDLAACRTYLGGLDLPEHSAEVLEVKGRGRWTWETDGLRRRVAEATTVRIRFTEDGDTFVETDAHVVLEDGLNLWFTDCGEPKEGAR